MTEESKDDPENVDRHQRPNSEEEKSLIESQSNRSNHGSKR
jgi:hypothetical protein